VHTGSGLLDVGIRGGSTGLGGTNLEDMSVGAALRGLIALGDWAAEISVADTVLATVEMMVLSTATVEIVDTLVADLDSVSERSGVVMAVEGGETESSLLTDLAWPSELVILDESAASSTGASPTRAWPSETFPLGTSGLRTRPGMASSVLLFLSLAISKAGSMNLSLYNRCLKIVLAGRICCENW